MFTEEPQSLVDVVDSKEDLLRRCDIARFAEDLAIDAAAGAELTKGLTPGDLWILPLVIRAVGDASLRQAKALDRWAGEALPWDKLLARSLKGLSASLADAAAQAEAIRAQAEDFLASERDQPVASR